MVSKKLAPVVVQLSMLENALDFIRSGLKLIASPQSKFDLKYAVLHLSAGTELVLKDRLRREDWKLIFADQASANKKDFASGNFRSVDLKECLKRLAACCDVTLPDKAVLQAFKSLRNPIEHFQMDTNRHALEASSAVVLGPLFDFIGEAFDERDLSYEESELLQEIRTLLVSFKRFTARRLNAIKPLLKAHRKGHGKVVECPSCLQDALMADYEVRCGFCGYTANCEDAATLYISNNYGGFYDPSDPEPERLYICPNCENHSLVFEGGHGDKGGICFSCGDTPGPADYDFCMDCNELSDPETMCGGRCSGCFYAFCERPNT